MLRNKNLKILYESDSDEDNTGFKTNTAYAKHYDEFRKKEILTHLKNIDEEDSSSDDISTDEELINPEFDQEFFNTLAFLKNKDPTKYKEIPKFFENVPTIEDTLKSKQLKKSQKPITVADHQRQQLLKTEGRMSEDEDDKEEAHNQFEDLSYAAEQEKIKNDLKKALQDSSDEEDAKDADGFLKVRNKSNDEVQNEHKDYSKWLSGQKESKGLKPLKDFWTSKTLSKEDKFLRDYILNQRYLNNGEELNYDDVELSDDEAEVEKQDEYEHKYNFRYEEPDNDFIKRFPRKIDDSVRAEDNKRKEKRKEREERKAMEKEVKMKELREFQNIRKREIEEKLLVLKDVAGKDEFTMKEDDLNSDFDPDEHDRRMGAIFDNEYYGIDEGDQKPQFPDIDEELNIENWDNFDKSKVPNSPDDDEDDDPNGPHCEDDDFNMDCDYDPQEEKRQKLQKEMIGLSKGRKRKKKVSRLAAIIKKDKPAFDPTEGKSYAEYLDEYYKLDYEDIIGDTPCRFNYSECVPNDFGLSVEEILAASNKELNQWASLKKTMQNRPKNVEMNDVEKYSRMKNNLELKKKIFKSMYGEADDEKSEESEQDEEVAGNNSNVNLDNSKVEEKTVTPKKNKKKKPKNKKDNNQAASAVSPKPNNQVQNHKKQNSDIKKNQNNKRKLENGNDNAQSFKKRKFDQKKSWKSNSDDIGDNRLKAFGINPKKYHNKIKYAGNKQNFRK